MTGVNFSFDRFMCYQMHFGANFGRQFGTRRLMFSAPRAVLGYLTGSKFDFRVVSSFIRDSLMSKHG